MKPLTRRDFSNLLEFRTTLRRFLRWSEVAAKQTGITPAQHQLLLAVKGHPGDRAPTIGELAEHLLLRHHSTVELVDRAEQAGLVERIDDEEDGRVVRVVLTRLGDQRLGQLSTLHLTELRHVAPALQRLLVEVEEAPEVRAQRTAD